jgi:hypothetical protein
MVNRKAIPELALLVLKLADTNGLFTILSKKNLILNL